jgi:arylsulfatase A-like enzyme
MIIRIPGAVTKGKECRSPVGLIDVYPTLTDLCGLSDSTMRNKNGHPLGGYSMRPFLEDPEHGKWNGPPVALSCIEAGMPVEVNVPGRIGDQQFTVRSRDWRYVLTRTGAEELYDHRSDPNEWHNLADDQDFAAIKEDLKTQLLQMTGRASE